MRSRDVSQEQIVRILGLPACATLEYYWEDMHFRPDETIPHKLLAGDFVMQEALLRLGNRTHLADNLKKGWKLRPEVYNAVMALTPEMEKRLYRTELIRQTIAGLLEKCGMAPIAALGDCFRKLNIPEEVWREAYADQFDAIYHEIYCEETGVRYAVHGDAEEWAALREAQEASGVIAAQNPPALRLSGGWLPDEAELYFPALDWLSRHGVSPEDAAAVMQETLYVLQNGAEPDEFMTEIADMLEMDELPADAEAIFAALLDRVPRWALNGISMRELRMMQHADMNDTSLF